MAQRLLINPLRQSRPQRAMNLNRRTNDALGNLILTHVFPSAAFALSASPR